MANDTSDDATLEDGSHGYSQSSVLEDPADFIDEYLALNEDTSKPLRVSEETFETIASIFEDMGEAFALLTHHYVTEAVSEAEEVMHEAIDEAMEETLTDLIEEVTETLREEIAYLKSELAIHEAKNIRNEMTEGLSLLESEKLKTLSEDVVFVDASSYRGQVQKLKNGLFSRRAPTSTGILDVDEDAVTDTVAAPKPVDPDVARYMKAFNSKGQPQG